MLIVKVIIEGLGLGFLLYLICAIGIRKGAIGMVHLYSDEVRKRVVENRLTKAEDIKRRSIKRKNGSWARLVWQLYLLYFPGSCV
ncbi:MAG: hypothetical protein K5888_00580 [Lachnospiraceae bacterium]|nr:hypothetical protein [Lachnospiraceae bacterium]